MTTDDFSQVFDAIYKSQATMINQLMDPFAKQIDLTESSLGQMSQASVLKMYRGVATSDDSTLSEGLRTEITNLCEKYVRETELEGSSWLSILDIAYRTNNEDLATFASLKFETTFDFDGDKSEGTGRRVKNMQT